MQNYNKNLNLKRIYENILISNNYFSYEDSPWRDHLSGAILKLQELGKINELYEKWWKKQGTCTKDNSKGSGANALDVENVRVVSLKKVLCLKLCLKTLIMLEN